MCTLLFRHRPGDTYPLAILSNRDERHTRPSSGWKWHAGTPAIFAPRDDAAGGTWIGLSEKGVVAALTNIFPPVKGKNFRSRGALVIDMLALDRAKKARRKVRALLDESPYNKFNLLVADGLEAFMFSWDGKGLWEGRLNPGVYKVGNDPWDGLMQPEAKGSNAAWLESNGDALKSHPEICKHGEEYGTRSSSKILLDAVNPGQSQVWHAEGNPCETAYQMALEPAGAAK